MLKRQRITGTRIVKVSFILPGDDPRLPAAVVGDFNAWDGTARRLSRYPKDGTYRARMSLAPGRYEYKFVVDGEWLTDPHNPEIRSNCFGTFNSFLRVAAK